MPRRSLKKDDIEKEERKQSFFVYAPTSQTIMKIFWDVENITARGKKNVENFMEAVRSNMKDFKFKTTYAAAAQTFIDKNRDIEMNMQHANVDFCHAPKGESMADELIKKAMDVFFDEHGKDGWMVLISTDARAFTDTVETYTDHLVLIYDDANDLTKSSKIKKLMEAATYKIPLSHFIGKKGKRAGKGSEAHESTNSIKQKKVKTNKK